MQQNGLEVTDEMEDAMQEHEEKGHTAVLISINGKNSRKGKGRPINWRNCTLPSDLLSGGKISLVLIFEQIFE